MSLWRHLTRGLRTLTRPAAADNELADELQHYVDQATSDLIAHGLSPDEAQRRAQLELGNAVAVRDQVRSYGWENLMSDFFADLQYAFRQLRNNPGFSFTAVLILALGIGASTAIFSAVNPILFEPLPYPRPGRVVMLYELQDSGRRLPNFGLFQGLTQQAGPFEAAAALKPWQPAVTGLDQPERLDGQRVSAGYFRALGVVPALGRDFRPEEDVFRGPNVVILSDRMWRQRFNSDPAIVGRKITLETTLYQQVANNVFTVIGVMPASFENVLAPAAELWAPLQYDQSLPPDGREWGHHLQVVARLRPGVTVQKAAAQLDVLLPTLGRTYSKGFQSGGGVPKGVLVLPLHEDLISGVKPALMAILGAVILVLIIACVNVGNLLLARGGQRRGEFAMRAALGAQPQRLVRQLLTESLLLSAIGGILGLAVAQAGVRLLLSLSPAELPRLHQIGISAPVFLFAFLLTTVVGLIVGLVPAITASRSDAHGGLQQSSRTTSNKELGRRSLVVSEVSLACVLLVSAGLLLHSLERLFSINPGFDPSHLLTMQVQESGGKFAYDDARGRFFKQALEDVRQLPGVESAAFTSQLPLSGDYESYGIEYEAYPHDAEAAFRYSVSPEYFQTMHIPLRRGRLLNENDRPGASVAVLISESLAKRKFHDRDPIGQRIRTGPDMGHADRPWAIIVGVVGDVKQLSLAGTEPDAFYTTNTQWHWVDSTETLVIRARGDAAVLAPAVKAAIWSVDKDQPIVRVATMASLVATSEAQRRFVLMLFEIFAVVGLILAGTGLYGVLSGGVTERTREIGVRSALGASRSSIVALVIRQGMTLTGIGIGIGLLGAIAATQGLMSLLFGISRLDPLTYAAVTGLLATVAIVACWVPAWRAARVDPVIALRAE